MMRLNHALTIAIATLAATASVGGLLMPNLYRDSAFIKTAWFSNDIVTLALVPALAISFFQYKRGSTRLLRHLTPLRASKF